MKTFLKKTLFFLISIFLVWGGLEMFYRLVPNTYTEKHNSIQNNYNTAEILVFGNSHAFYGLNPKYFDRPAYNIANISQTIYFDKLLFNRHVERFKNLKWIILNIEYTSLSHQDNTSEDVWRKYFYQAHMDIEVSTIPFYDLRQYSLTLNRTFPQSIATLKQYYKSETIVECDELGFGHKYTYENRRDNLSELAQKTIEKHEDGLTDFSINSERIQRMIAEANKRNINVLLVTMPVSDDYARGVNQEKLQKIFRTAQNLADVNQNCLYLNLFDTYYFSDDDFFDPDHLNSRGAEKCSVIINTQIQ